MLVNHEPKASDLQAFRAFQAFLEITFSRMESFR